MDQNSGSGTAGIPFGVRITGEVTAAEDLVIHGHVEGQVTAPAHHVTIGPGGAVHAKVVARVVTVSGRLEGSITASERVRILADAQARGHVHTPSFALSDGAVFTGTADPQRTEAAMHVARYRQKQQE